MNATLIEPATNGELAVRPPTIIELAVQKGMDAGGITQLVELVRQERRDQAEKDYTDAIRSVTARAGVILKSKQGSKARYAPLEEVNNIVTPLYTAAGLSLSFSEADCPLADENWKRHVCDVRHSGGHKERYHLDLPLDGAETKGGMNAIQGAISTGSYAQRVLLCRIFNLTIALTDLDGGKPDEPISDGQLADLDALIERFKDAIAPKPFKYSAFLKAFGGQGCESPRDFTQAAYREAVNDLKRQMKGCAS